MDHPKKERTLVIIKPDGIQRTLIGEIIHRYERTGLKLAALKMTIPDVKMVEKHYTVDPDWIRKVGEKSILSYEKKGSKRRIKIRKIAAERFWVGSKNI